MHTNQPVSMIHKNFKYFCAVLDAHQLPCFLFSLLMLANVGYSTAAGDDDGGDLYIGWAMVDMTPSEPLIMYGSKISGGVLDAITATVLAIESRNGTTSENVIMISCDLIAIPDGSRDKADNLRDSVRAQVVKMFPDIKPEQIILNATHTHSAPHISTKNVKEVVGVELDVMPPGEYFDFITRKIATAVGEAWKSRKPGGISYGFDYAVIGHNRIQVEFSGKAQMHGNINKPEFSHIEGYQDHSMNLLYTWDKDSNLTGVVINVACTSQVTYGNLLSSDFWANTRKELGNRLGENVYILPQSSAGGDLSPHDLIIDERANDRMNQLKFPGYEEYRLRLREGLAHRISNSVTSVLPYMKEVIEWNPMVKHEMEVVGLSKMIFSPEDVVEALISYPGKTDDLQLDYYEAQYEKGLKEVEANPGIRKTNSSWYADIARSHSMMRRALRVQNHYDTQLAEPKYYIEIHTIRIGDIAIATNPFELYLDYGIRMKARSPAIQTFVVQLAGSGYYLPTQRSINGRAYGAIPASNVVGPKGGQELVEHTLRLINGMWEDEK
jgi:hypothetical protein